MFIDNDFRDMKIPPLEDDPDYEKLFKDVPSISEWNEIPIHKKKLVNYILLMYDPASPFVKRFQNLIKRTETVADYIGLGKLKQETFDYITTYNNPPMLEMIDDFVKWINIRVWGLIVVNETVFYEYQRELMVGVSGKESKDKLQALTTKNKILESMDTVSARIDTYYSQLYANDKELEKSLKTKRITPEGIALGTKYA